MVVESELFAVVAATHQVALAARVTVVGAAVAGTVTVALAFIAGVFRSAASSVSVIAASASLTFRWFNGKSTQW